MRKYINGQYVEMTTDEIADVKSAAVRDKLMQRSSPLSGEEVTQLIIAQQINSLEVDNNTALRMKEFYPTFDSIVGQTVGKGFKFTHGGKLWEVIQPECTIQSYYAPGTDMESLYTEVCETHAGTLDDPIPYSGNMAMTEGLYYDQDYVIYRCTRNTGNPVYHPLEELVGLYVEVYI